MARKRILCTALATLMLASAGCGGKPTNLVGLSAGQLTAKLGMADSRSKRKLPAKPLPSMGPSVTVLSPGDAYEYLYYGDVKGRQLHIFCVSPKVYRRVRGTSPGAESLYVIEVQDYPAGVVF